MGKPKFEGTPRANRVSVGQWTDNRIFGHELVLRSGYILVAPRFPGTVDLASVHSAEMKARKLKIYI